MVSIIIPTYNASIFLPNLLQRLKEQTQPHELIIIDSESDEATQKIFEQEKLRVTRIKKAEFNHGSTRNLGLRLAKSDTLIFMTQDALPVSHNTLERLVDSLYSQPNIALAYGRQLAYPTTGIFGRFARLLNYPAQSVVKDKSLIEKMGIKTCSCSNSFAAYRKTDLLEVGGFPEDTILGEDVSVAARLILKGKAVAYCAEAEVFHSHDYTVWEEFKRYFDIGVFHQEQNAVLKEFQQAEYQGLDYVIQEWLYLINNRRIFLIPTQIVRTIAKYLGYRLGRQERNIPKNIKRLFSMHKVFWQ
jgi:rhamnosyltransferase